jgi:hypothetical protein
MPSLVLPRADVLKLDSGKQYYIRNNTDRPLTLPDGRTPLLRYARIPYPVASHQQEIIPFDVIALYFGDPRSRNGMVQKYVDSRGEGFIQSREAELGRIAVFWGVYEQGVDSLMSVVPDVTISTLQGQEIVPPCFDPYGEYSYGFDKGPVDTQQGAAAQLSSMQEQMDQLRAQMEALSAGGDNDQDIPEDLPTMPAMSHRGAGGVPAPSSP